MNNENEPRLTPFMYDPNSLISNNPTENLLYMLISKLDNKGCTASNKYLALNLGVSEHTVSTKIGKLEAKGLITIKRQTSSIGQLRTIYVKNKRTYTPQARLKGMFNYILKILEDIPEAEYSEERLEEQLKFFIIELKVSDTEIKKLINDADIADKQFINEYLDECINKLTK